MPRAEEIQPLPAGMLKKIPLSVHLNRLKIENSFVSYEEQPKEGDETGTLKIERMSLVATPFINYPQKNDPYFLTIKTEGSLIGFRKSVHHNETASAFWSIRSDRLYP